VSNTKLTLEEASKLARDKVLSELAALELDGVLLLKDRASSEELLLVLTLLEDNSLARVVPIGVLVAPELTELFGVAFPLALVLPKDLVLTMVGVTCCCCCC